MGVPVKKPCNKPQIHQMPVIVQIARFVIAAMLTDSTCAPIGIKLCCAYPKPTGELNYGRVAPAFSELSRVSYH